ncbi:MAG: glycosyltransferase family 2 protein, partial [Clostridiaceae bacterium]|nr:glycosyltransferase family 2 protein [Clostridiaceae bacterium]
MVDVAVIIPTQNRPASLAKALASIAGQTLYPDRVIAVSDCDDAYEDETKSVVREASEQLPTVEYIRNRRTKNLSGAVNTGLARLIELGVCPESTFVALLDDDDEWEPGYLKTCMGAADSGGSDLVVAGLVRHESESDPGTLLSIPEALSTHDFFVGNPHVQGSNLFVRLSTLLQAGGFDEALDSTTDRDVCIRLLDLGTVKAGFVRAHLVHHWALPTQERLSTPGSMRKTNGLQAFYRKYAPRMTPFEREAFRKRAHDLFGCAIEEPLRPEGTTGSDRPNELSRPQGEPEFPIVVGFMATRMDSTENLLDDLVAFFEDSATERSIVVYDNSRSTAMLQRLVGKPKYAPLNCRLLDAETIERESERGTYGKYLAEPANRMGIASGRTILHHALYREAKKYPSSVVWVLDDDIRLERVNRDGTVEKVTLAEVQRALVRLKMQGVSIANGQVTGDAPIPAHSMLRTQLVDLFAHLKICETGGSVGFGQTGLPPDLIAKYPDYYYDYSDLHTAHLETPFRTGADCGQLLRRVPDIGSGINLFRPVVAREPETAGSMDVPRPIPPRGGNTMVLNPVCLRMFP